jgi:hypothetical protein
LKERKDREVIEKEMETENELNAKRESEKEMERKEEAAMEQMKILDLVFGKDCNEMKQLVEDSIRMIKEKVRQQDSEECDRIFKGTRVYTYWGKVLVKRKQQKELNTLCLSFSFATVAVKKMLEEIVKRSGIIVFFQWLRKAWTL